MSLTDMTMEAPAIESPKLTVERYTLPNGLTVLLSQDKSAPGFNAQLVELSVAQSVAQWVAQSGRLLTSTPGRIRPCHPHLPRSRRPSSRPRF